MKVAVVGHVEWIRFARVERLPGPGEIAHSTDDWDQAGGGGGVAAIQLALLADEAHLFTALGDDELGRRSRASSRSEAFTSMPPRILARSGGRSCTWTRWGSGRSRPSGRSSARSGATIGCRGPSWPGWTRCCSSRAMSRHFGSRAAHPSLTATARDLDILRRGGVALDALIGSGEDEAERYHAGDLDPEPDLVVTTSGALGGWMQPGGPYTAAVVPGPREDTYGCGDSFMAGLTFALGADVEPHDAVAFAARCGAAALTGRGVAPQSVAL